jgi:hypothetical protein
MFSWSNAPLLLSIGLAVGMGLAFDAGRRLGQRSLERASELASVDPATSAIHAAIMGLVALLLAFGVTTSAARFDTRRRLIVDEANAIGTAYLRLDLLPAGRRSHMQEQFRSYLDCRIATLRRLPDVAAAKVETQRCQAMQRAIWTEAIAAVNERQTFAPMPVLLLAALNQMIDLSTTRTMVSQLHAPRAMLLLLVVALFAGALYAGYAMGSSRRQRWMHTAGFLLLHALAFAIILDLEFPRLGYLREDGFDRVLVDLRESMNGGAP